MSSTPSEKNINNRNKWQQQRREEEYHGSRAWAILLFGFIGATATTLAVCQMRRTSEWLCSQMNKSQSNSSRRNGQSRSGWGAYREEAWRRYNRRMQEEHEEEMQRVERIRRMQNIFNRERNKYKRSYESWRVYGPDAYQQYQRDDWYWQYTDTSYKNESSYSGSAPRYNGNNSLSHHYSVLGLDRSRTTPYSDAEIKAAFRVVAMKYHPDQNQNNKQAAEEKFKEMMASYEAIKLERKNTTLDC